ncbi:MAG: MarP family serine protease [Propionibacteriales bacterium]|nr:MarP family serine protease [Propionibacteriales bacterium]
MNALDIVLALAVVVYALSGYQQGFIVGLASTLGLLLGGFLGARITPLLLDAFDPGFEVSVAALLMVLAGALSGQGVGSYVGDQFRNRLTWQPAHVLDAIGGSALSAVAVLLIAWVLGVAVSGAEMRGLNNEVRTSVVLRGVDTVLPGGADRVLATYNTLVGSSHFPRYLEPFAPERIKDVPAPSDSMGSRPAVARAAASVVKIIGPTLCGRTVEGSGFVYAPGRVMTNAHVVAGVTSPIVSLNGTDHPATVVYYDSEVDIAVLAVEGMSAPGLRFDNEARSGESVAVLGFPLNGPYDVQPGRVRDRQQLRSPDIYGSDTVVRDTYSIYSLVRQGNSGGPLLDRGGEVVGVIFAASVTDTHTGYALTADQVADAAGAGSTSNKRVSTGDCAL